MDYMTLFSDTDRVCGGPFTLVAYRDGGQDIRFFSSADYIMVFCLQGDIIFKLKYGQSKLEAGQLLVVHSQQIRWCICSPGTVLLKYATAGKLSEYMDKCAKAFQTDSLSPVTILPSLAEWLDGFARQLVRESGGASRSYAVPRRELVRLLMAYSQRDLKEMFVPMFACSRQCGVTGECISLEEELENAVETVLGKPEIH